MSAITVIGPGRHGTAIAQLFATHGFDVTLFHYKQEKANAVAQHLASVASHVKITVADTLADAVEGNDLVVLATLWDKPQREVIGALGDALNGKILLDISNPLDVTPFGIVPRTPVEGSAGQFVHGLLSEHVGHAKAFSNLSTAAILEGADHTPPAVLPYLADSADTAQRVAFYLGAIGWKPWLAGDFTRSRDIEIGGIYNDVFGTYGRSRLNETEMLEHSGPEFSFA